MRSKIITKKIISAITVIFIFTINAFSALAETYNAYVSGTDGTLVINSIPKAGNGIGLIPEGGTVTVDTDRTSGNWLWVTYNGVSGYSYKDYLIRVTGGDTYTAYAVNTDGSLAINSIPKAGNQVGAIPEGAGATVDPSRTSGNWLWVTYNGVSGYSYKDYLTTTPPSNSGNSGHAHSFPYVGYEQQHPHKVYKECTCGYTEYTGETKYLSGCSECNPPTVETPVEVLPPKADITVSTTNANNISTNNATVYGSVSYSGSRPSEVGIYFGSSSSSMSKVAGDKIGHNKNPFNMWYDLKNEAGQSLSANTTYYWQCYAVVNGTEYKGAVKSFKTESTVEWKFPLENYTRITTNFSSSHQAVDFAAPLGTGVYAAKSGIIIKKYTGCNNYSREHGQCRAGGVCNPIHGYSTGGNSYGYCNDGFGNGYIIRHDDGSWAEYAHMNYLSSSLEEGNYVSQGTYLGGVSSTGVSTGPHLHFGIRLGDNDNFWRAAAINPIEYVGS